ncbi:MAG: YhdP family protein [Sulfuriferula sp.]
MPIPVRLWIRRSILYFLIFLTIAFTALVLALRLWILPNLDQWRGPIAASISRSAQQKVILGQLSANWLHWHPQLFIQFVRVLGHDNHSILFLSNVRTELSWTSLIYGEVRLAKLSIDDLVLSMRRDKNGTLYLAEIIINGPKHKSHLADWLLNQREIKVNNATLSWQDDLRSAPLLIVSQINLDLINSGKLHKFRINASPPLAIAQPVDLHGELIGKNLEDLASWHGQILANATRTDLAQWRPWITLPYGITRGYGNFSLQLQIAKQQIIAATVGTVFHQLSLQFNPALPDLNLLDLSGQLEWKRLGTAQSIDIHKLSMRTQDLVTISDLDCYLRLAPATRKSAATGDLKVNTLSLQTLTRLAAYFPLTPTQQSLLSQRQPVGNLSQIKAHWLGDLSHPDDYQIHGQFMQLGLASTAVSPGFSGLNGHIEADAQAGTLMLDSQHSTLDLTGILFVPHVALDTLTAELHWGKTAAGYDIKLADANFSNVDAAGSLLGEYQWQPGQRGFIDLTGNLSRGDAKAVYRYLPLAIKQPAYNWLKTSLLGGNISSAAFHLKGDLAQFPFHNDKNGLLDVDVQFANGVLQPGPDFPVIDHISGDLKFFGSSMTMRSDSAKLYNAHLHDISVAIPDLFAKNQEVLYINGDGEGDISDLIRFANNSPVAKVAGNLTAGATGAGKAQVLLQLQLPFHDIKHPIINGTVTFINDNITPNKPIPHLDAVNGKLNFTQTSINVQNITLQLLGGTTIASTQNLPGGVVRINLLGHMTAAGLAPYLPGNLAAKISGDTSWQGKIDLIRGQPSPMEFDSDLSGLNIDLPQPFNKMAADKQVLHISTHPTNINETLINVRYGNLFSAALLRSQQADNSQIEHAAVNFGGVAQVPGEPGLWISGHLPTLDLAGWSSESKGSPSGEIPTKIDINVSIGQLDLFQRQFNTINLHAKNTGSTWQADVVSAAMQGKINWVPRSAGKPNDKLSAHFKTLSIPDAKANTVPTQPTNTALWPELMLDVDDLQLGKRHLGQLAVRATPIPGGLRFEQILLNDSDSKLQMSAIWRPQTNPETVATIRLDIKNIGQFFDRFGHPDTIKGGTAIIDGQADWNGTPVDITLTSLAGSFTLTAENGQFLKIDPGAAKLLGVLSLQALPRHIGLDFSDIFSDGFAFEDISATMRLNRGIIYSKDFLMNGPAASVQMSGTIDMNAQTQQLQASVSPKLNGTVALASSLLGGPVVALGVYAAEELLKNPLGNAVQFDYTITGPWADPIVKKVSE